MKEYLEDLRENFTNPYWWADHWVEQTIAIVCIYGVGSIFFHIIDIRLAARLAR